MASAATERWNRWAARQSRGAFVVPVELNYALVEVMLDQGLISERDSEDRDKLGQAVRRFFTNALDDRADDRGDNDRRNI